MDTAASLVIGGTSGLGREVAQQLADRGERVLVAGRDGERAQRVAAEIGGQGFGFAMDLAEPETIADALVDLDRIDHLVIASAEGYSNSVRDFDVPHGRRLATLKLVGYTETVHVLALSADAFTAVAENADHGYPILEHIVRVLGAESEIIWAPAIDGAFLLSVRGGDYELHVGQDLSIGYLSHDANSIELYFQESMTFLVLTGEAGVEMTM